ncbi:hypothetical protein [Gordonia polyisoprenivorans]|uniref:hypothetical protein n=1 Tax=Gordonia polyisoprenivorans TaxID=84595 RepID=UPI0030D45791
MTTATAKRSGITVKRTVAGVVAAGAIITGVGAGAGLASAAPTAPAHQQTQQQPQRQQQPQSQRQQQPQRQQWAPRQTSPRGFWFFGFWIPLP